MRRALFLVLLLQVCYLSWGQNGLTEIKGLPTKEIFDLLVDRKGFLWVGHDMGISRYDGVSFTHFAHPRRSSLSITDLVEDRFGRIWFHNFTGQIFYIENDQIFLLDAYQNEAENYFPRMALCNDELVVTSRFGLFVCDTRTLKGRYVKTDFEKVGGTLSLSAVGENVLASGKSLWFIYSKKKGLQTVQREDEVPLLESGETYTLQPTSFNDTAYLIINPTGVLAKLLIKGNDVVLANTMKVHGYINSTTPDGKVLWINAKDQSVAITPNAKLQPYGGYNISDVVTDFQGNRWISTLGQGLLVEPATASISKIDIPFLKSGGKVTAMHGWQGNMLMGTDDSRLFLYDFSKQKLVWDKSFAKGIGSVTYISQQRDSNLLIGTSSLSYLMNREGISANPFSNAIIKAAALKKNYSIAASSAGLFLMPPDGMFGTNSAIEVVDLNGWNNAFRSLIENGNVPDKIYLYQHRVRTLALLGDSDLYVSFMTGVFQLGGEAPKPLMVDSEKVYANSMIAHCNKLFIGTLNAGLIVKKKTEHKFIAADEGLFSNSIVRMKKTDKYLWVFQDKAIQLLDLDSEALVHGVELPQESGANVHDVAVVGDTALLSTNNGLYKVLLQPAPAFKVLKTYLQAMQIGRNDEIALTSTTLSHNQNNIQFNLSIPYYSPSNTVYFKYRLVGGEGEDQWFVTQEGERIVRFSSLNPGSYTFEAIAVVGGSQEGTPATFKFTIEKPWWRTITFYLSSIGLLALMFYGVYRYRIRQVLKVEQVRRTISKDLHDEIGSTLSSINIYSAMARKDGDHKEYLDLIQENTREVIGKLDDLVWSINPKNDTVVQLVARMRSFAEPLLKGAGIGCSFEVNESLLVQELPLVTKRNLYLIFKELVNNVVKHSSATHCQIKLEWNNGHISMVVADNGVGIDLQHQPTQRHGMENLVSRTRSMKAFIYFQENNVPGTSVRVMVPVKVS